MKAAPDASGSFYKTDKALVDDCVQAYLLACDSILTQARGQATGHDGWSVDNAIQEARLAWSALSRARLFCIHPEKFQHLHSVADRYTAQLAGVEDYSIRHTRLRLRADDVTLDLLRIWGFPDFKNAADRGYVKPNPAAGANSFLVSDLGMEAIKKRMDRLPAETRTRLHQLYTQYDQAVDTGNKVLMVQSIDEIEHLTHGREAEADAEKMVSVYEDYGFQWPFPDPLPFDSCFFAYGQKLNLTLSPTSLYTRFRRREHEALGEPDVYLLGHLLAWEGDIPFIFTLLDLHGPDGRAVAIIRAFGDGEWNQPMSLDPWILTMLIRTVNEHKSIIQDYSPSLANRLDRKQLSKRQPTKQFLPLPSPFYMVNLKDELIEKPKSNRPSLPGRPVEWAHRWDVRGHECVRIERGELPLTDKDRARLKKRDYRIYEGMSLSADDAGRLLKRGVRAPGPREWIAVLSYWREAFVKGPADRPYVPAARFGA